MVDTDSQAYKVLNEILMTEKSYAIDLTTLVTRYRGEGLAQLKQIGVSESQFAKVFSNAVALEQFHRTFCAELEEQMTKQSFRTTVYEIVSDLFLKHIGLMTAIYSTYCSESLSRQEALQKLVQAKGWVDFTQTLTGVADISSFLIKPVQRLTRYPLLFDQLMKNTDKESQEYEKIALATEKLKKMADDCNADSRLRQNEARMTKFRETLEGFDVSKLGTIGNYIILEKEVVISVGKSSTRHKLLAFLLMDHIVLAKASKSREKLQFRFLIRLDLAFIEPLDAPQSDDCEFPFSIDVVDESNTAERFIFWETSSVGRESWINEVKPRTTSVGLSSSWRARRNSEFRQTAKIQSSMPHPLMRASNQSHIPLVDMLRRSGSSANTSGTDSLTTSSDSASDTLEESPRELKKRKADSGTVRKLGKLLGEAVNLQGDQLAVLDSPKDKRRLSSRREKLGGSRAMPVLEKPGQLRRGRSRSFGDDIHAMQLGARATSAESIETAISNDGISISEKKESKNRRDASVDASKDEVKKSSSMSSASVVGDKRLKLVVEALLDDLYQARSAVSVGNKSDAKALISKMITQLEQFQI